MRSSRVASHTDGACGVGAGVMEYSILTIRSAGEQDGRLFPAVDGECDVVLEQWDGEPLKIAGSGLSVCEPVPGGWTTKLRLKDVKLDLLITESRLVISSRKYDKGRGWRALNAAAA